MAVFDFLRKKKVEKVFIEKKQEIDQAEKDKEFVRGESIKCANEYISKNKNTKYDFFGYLTDPDQTPFFIEENKKYEGNFQFNRSVTPYTPEMLAFCVKNLTHDAMKTESKNVTGFVKKCYQISRTNESFSKEAWDKVISDLTLYIQKPHHLSKEQLQNLLSNLTEEQLNQIDWKMFGKELKRRSDLPPSYNSEPQEVFVQSGKDGVAKAKLKFISKTSDSIRELLIRKGDVFVYVNGANNGQPDKSASQCWKAFCGATFEQEALAQSEKQKQ